ncbi:lipocalin-like domain-containing protein, partial [Chloroflexi bacterium TSY]|nr:lipocalin-like domain-containing protein [Chloroflexi bacterium TSY]
MNSNDIAGTWELVSWQQLDGTLEHPYGTDPVGYLTYH